MSLPPAITAKTDHRPWPMPDRPWTVAMTWHDLLFMHWPLPISLLRRFVPAGLEIDTFDGNAWLGLVPFHMSGVRPRIFPRILESKFPELNVRTYVNYRGKPGVWFFSLDAAHWPTVKVARLFYHLPYHHARMSVSNTNGTLHYASRRLVRRRTAGAEFVGEYKPAGSMFHSASGSLDHFLTERYCLFSLDPRGQIHCAEIHHSRWPLQPAEADIQTNTMFAPLGFGVHGNKPILHFAERLEVIAWPLCTTSNDTL